MRRGVNCCAYDTRETLAKLAAVIDRFQPETLISLGDSLHYRGAADRIGEQDLETLAMLQEACVDLGNGKP